MAAVKKSKNVAKKAADPKKAATKAGAPKTSTATATKTATSTKTSTDAYTQGNVTVTGGAGKGATNVKISLPGGALANRGKAKGKKNS